MRKDKLFLIFSFLICCCSTKPEEKTTTKEVLVIEPLTEVDTKPIEVVIEKEILFENYLLEDIYPYKDTSRQFLWEKIRERLVLLDSIQLKPKQWGVLQNRKNINGEALLVKTFIRNDFNRVTDTFGVERYQAIPLYSITDSVAPERYGRDGSLIEVLRIDSSDFAHFKTIYFNGEWLSNKRYVKLLADTVVFNHAVFVDRTNQNIATLEKVDSIWYVRSMNPATTGKHKPPYMHETPDGMFVFQEKKRKMIFHKDGSSEHGGFAPYACRFSSGGYIHGIPVNAPREKEIEYSASLGTTPKSHMCVRNATSHAKFIYDNFPTEATIVFVFD